MQLETIVTKFGVLNGRNAIYLDKIEFEGRHTVTLIGEINGNLLENEYKTSNSLKYTFVFRQILAFEMIELDSWFINAPEIWHEQGSSLNKVINSQWVQSLGGKVTPKHQHFIIQTYDDVFQIVCETIEIQMD